MLLLLWRLVIGTTVTRQVSFFLLFWWMMAINVDVLLRQMIERLFGETILSKILLRVSNKKRYLFGFALLPLALFPFTLLLVDAQLLLLFDFLTRPPQIQIELFFAVFLVSDVIDVRHFGGVGLVAAVCRRR